MDSFEWDDSLIVTNPSSSWRNQQQEIIQENLIISESNGCSSGTGKMSISEYNIYSPIQQLQKVDSSFINLSQSDNIRYTGSSNWNFSRNPGKLAPKSKSFGVTINGQESSSSEVNRSDYTMNQENYQISGFGMENQHVFGGIQEIKTGISNTGSLESIDCLLSATNSQTDTSVEDDGISMFFSDYKNLWNSATVKSVSQTSTDDYVNNSRSSGTKPNPNKRTSSESQLNATRQYQNLEFFQSNSSNPPPKSKKTRLDQNRSSSSNKIFQQPSSSASSMDEPDSEAIVQMKEMIYRAAAFRPVNFGTEIVEKPKRKNVRISSDPQTVAARQRRERISERIRVLQRLVPGGSKMDTASMLDEAANYLKFLTSQVKALETLGHQKNNQDTLNFPSNATNLAFYPLNHSFFMPSQFSLKNPNPIHQSKS